MENQRKQSFLSAINPTIVKIFFVLLILGVGWYAYSAGWIPGLTSEKSKEVKKAEMSKDEVNTTSKADMLPIPDIMDMEYADVENRPQIRLMNWIWFGNAGIFSANGGSTTMQGSLMDKFELNLKMKTNNSVSDMKREQLAFIEAYAKGNKNPTQGVHFVTLMGDGFPAYVSAMNAQIEKAYGSEYRLKTIGIAGFSMGEDCLMGPQIWKDDPASMKGAVISTVIGDGDWALNIRFAADNQDENKKPLKINPDPDTYDENAINFYPAPNDDFLAAAEEVIAGRTVTLKLKDANGKLTGKTVTKRIEGAATWFPADRNIVKNTNLVKVVSTSQYPNQMGTVIVGCDKWMQENSATVVKFLSATLTATNQIKQHAEWFQYATQLAPKVFCTDADECGETAEDWYRFAKPHGAKMDNVDGTPVSIGGTQMANLADNKKYFGIKGGNNYYESVYTYFSDVIRDLNPAGFMDNVKELTSYEDAVDLRYLKQVNIDAGTATKIDYSENKGEAFASRSWKIEFETGSAQITPAGEVELEKLFDAVNIAENARVDIIGHTDDVGDATQNLTLSEKRAKAVKTWLLNRSANSFPAERFSIEGKGEMEPVAQNTTPAGRQQNRRVQITLLQ